MIFTDLNDTICAISTPAGTGGIAVVRISGPRAIEIADSAWKGRSLAQCSSHTAHLGDLTDCDGSVLDNCVATIYRAPRSFTGDDVVELSIHGSRWLQRAVLDMLIRRGARLAAPGEFTRRAFAAGKIDLAQAEAVADIIASSSRAAHRIAISQMRGHFSRRLSDLRENLLELASLLELELDFSEEDVEFASRAKLLEISNATLAEVTRLHNSFSHGAAIKDGIPVAIIGKTNAGKSSLLNALLGDDKAIVSDIHGTTRDLIEDSMEIGDYRFRFIDTAGIRHTTDTIERIGIDRSLSAARRAHIIIMVVDAGSPHPTADIDELCAAIDNSSRPQLIVALNKADRNDTADMPATIDSHINRLTPSKFSGTKSLSISATRGDGLDTLQATLEKIAADTDGHNADDVLITNARHAQSLAAAAQSLRAVVDGLNTGLSGDFIAQDLRQALSHLSELTGEISAPDILASIFTRFCIGK